MTIINARPAGDIDVDIDEARFPRGVSEARGAGNSDDLPEEPAPDQPAAGTEPDGGDGTVGGPAGVVLTADDPDRILHVDPAELIVGANVRVDPRLDKEFLASIKADGVAVVITVYRNQERDLVVITGQRRAAGP